jgi:hypothetical protein
MTEIQKDSAFVGAIMGILLVGMCLTGLARESAYADALRCSGHTADEAVFNRCLSEGRHVR